QGWVSGGLDPNQTRFIAYPFLDLRHIGGVNKMKLNTVVFKKLRENAIRAAVQVVARNHLVPRTQQFEDSFSGRHPARERQAILSVLQSRDAVFQGLARRVGTPRVLVALMVTRRGLLIGGSLVDRRHDRSRRRVGLLSGMNGFRCEFISHGLLRYFVFATRKGIKLSAENHTYRISATLR